jgi:hypothetical protein
MQQKEEPEESALPMEIGGGELSDESGKYNRHSQERQRQAVHHEHQWEAVVMHCKPITEGHHDSARTGCAGEAFCVEGELP